MPTSGSSSCFYITIIYGWSRWRDKRHQIVDNFQIFLKWLWNVFYISIPRFIAFHFIALCRYCVWFFFLSFFFSNKPKVCGNSAPSKSASAVFPIAFAPFMSPCHSLVIPTYFKPFRYYICCGDLWSVIFNLIVLGCYKSCLFEMANLIDDKHYVCFDCSADQFPHFSPSPLASLVLETQ